MRVAETDGLREFYSAQQPRLVGVISLLTGSRAEAEDIVQEAFVRLVPRWSKVSRYDAPEAWVRLVAVRLAANRHRNSNRFTQLFHRLPRGTHRIRRMLTRAIWSWHWPSCRCRRGRSSSSTTSVI
jgi:DNA-directed RNA polymerase specialized sigma24 family protein